MSRGHYSKLPKRLKALQSENATLKEALALAIEGLELNCPGYAHEVKVLLEGRSDTATLYCGVSGVGTQPTQAPPTT